MSDKPALDQGGPLWRRIASSLQSDVTSGVFGPGARLPTEAELAARFNVNRHTVRRAMADLQARNLIRVEQGRGSFVTEDILRYRISARTRFAENLREQNRQPHSRFVSIEESPAGEEIAKELGLRHGRPVIFAERQSWADDRPIAIGRHWFCANRFPGIAARLAKEESIAEALAQLGVPDYARGSTRISARLPTRQEAAFLDQPRTMPVLVTHAVNYDPQGKPVEVSVGVYPGSRVEILVSD